MNIYVTGPIGSDRRGLAHRLAKEKHLTYLDMDEEITRKDGRSIRRLCMMMGEHEHRNKEYEVLEECAGRDGLVCACSDAILLDPMCADLARQGTVVIADPDLSCEALWEKAKNDPSIPYAFLLEPDEKKKKKKFEELYQRRKPIYDACR